MIAHPLRTSDEWSTAELYLCEVASLAHELAQAAAAGDLDLIDAVDIAYDRAVARGLEHTIGVDVIQGVLAIAFERVGR